METQNKPMENVFVYVKSIYEKTGCRSMTSGEVYNLITGGALRQQTEHIRQLQAGENKKEEVDAAKRKLGGILSHAVFSGGRVGQNAESHTGCLMFDIDHCKTPARDVVRRASQLPYVLLATVSVRGEGVHVIVRADVCLANHSEVYKHVAKIITAALGEEIDPACKDLSRVMFLSHDAEAYYNPNASILHLLHTLTNDQKNNNSDNRTLTTDIARYLDAASITMTSGSRHTQLTSLAGCLVNAGFDMDDAIRECVRRYAEPDFGEKEIEDAIRGIYNKGRADFGKNRKEKPFRKSSESSESAKSSHFGGGNPEEEPQEVDIEDSGEFLPVFPQIVYDSLPDGLKKLVPEHMEGSLRDISLLTVLTISGSAMPLVKGVFRRREVYPDLYVSIIGESGSGKGSIAPLYKLVSLYHKKISNESRKQVRRYQQEKDDYEQLRAAYRKQLLQNPGSKEKFTAEEPMEVYQKELCLSGYVTAAKLDDMLAVNSPYCTLFFETEMETINKLNNSDYGMYNDTLNKVFQHEFVGSHTISRGSQSVDCPKLSLVMSGTPGMFRKMIPDAENGTFSRMLMYRLRPANHFIPLTSEDGPSTDEELERQAAYLLEMADYLWEYPTMVKWTDAQRQRVNRFFESCYVSNIAFSCRERNSTVQRYALMLFRLTQILTAARKYDDGWKLSEMFVDDVDFETAFSIIKVCLKHSDFVATSLSKEKDKIHYTMPDDMHTLFVKLSDKFTRAEAVKLGATRKISESRIEKMLMRALKCDLIVRESYGCYVKTERGLHLLSEK